MEKSVLYHVVWFIANLDKMIAKKMRKRLFANRFKSAKKEALTRQAQTGRKQFVIVIKGRPQVVSKHQMQILIRRKYFKKGTTIQEIERMALFVTENYSKKEIS